MRSISLLFMLVFSLYGDVSGFVFRDFNANGIKDANEEGERGVSVEAHDIHNNVVAQTKTDILGNYTLKLKAKERYSILFSDWKPFLSPAPHGKDNKSNPQRVFGDAKNVSFGLFNKDQYTQIKAGKQSIDLSKKVTSKYEGLYPAPLFEQNLSWFNTKALQPADFRGKVVMLSFFSAHCINSIKMLAKLKMLAKRFEKELLIIGVYTAKYEEEKNNEYVRKVVQDLKINYPVVNDSNHTIAKSYGLKYLPSLGVINPIGRYMGMRYGLSPYSFLEDFVRELVREFDARGLVNRDKRIALSPLTSHQYPSDIAFVDGHLWASCGNRVVNLDTNESIGSAQRGYRDGAFATASFDYPSALASDGTRLLIIDYFNHAIREAKDDHVRRIAGTNERILTGVDSGEALVSRLDYPSDILGVNDTLYIAMKGAHQIWKLQKGKLSHVTGESQQGFEGNHFIAPSHLASDGRNRLFISDSEANAIKVLELNSSTLHLLAGKGYFGTGDVDGAFKEARFAYPQGILYDDEKLYICDTHNKALKVANLKEQTIKTLHKGFMPTAITKRGDRLYILDRFASTIYIYSLKTNTIISERTCPL